MADLETIDGKLDMIITSIATIEQRCVNRGNTIDGHQKTLYGNDGRGGVVATVNTLNGANADRKQWSMKIIAPIIAALITATIFGGITIWAIVMYGK